MAATLYFKLFGLSTVLFLFADCPSIWDCAELSSCGPSLLLPYVSIPALSSTSHIAPLASLQHPSLCSLCPPGLRVISVQGPVSLCSSLFLSAGMLPVCISAPASLSSA